MNMEAGAGMVSRLSVMVSSEAVVFKEAVHMLRGLPGKLSRAKSWEAWSLFGV